MADFRKWFMVIAVVLFATACANAAVNSTTSIPCTTSAQPATIRAGGITEYIGEIDLDCDATSVAAPGGAVTVQFTLTLGAGLTPITVTNATSGVSADVPPAPLTMAGVVVQQDVPPETFLHTVQGRVSSSYGNLNNALRFPHVVLPSGTTFKVRFFNVRVDALALNGAPFGTQMFAQVTANTENPSGYAVGFTNEPAEGLLVAQVQPTVNFWVSACDSDTKATPSITFQQCVDYRLGGITDAGVTTVLAYGVTFQELQQTAFKNLVEEDGATIGPGAVVPFGPQICDTNHGGTGGTSVMSDMPPTPPCADPTAYVSQGTRLLAQFQVAPSLAGKIHIYVTRYQTASSNGATASLARVSSSGDPTSDLGWGLASLTNSSRTSCHGTGGAAINPWVEVPQGQVVTNPTSGLTYTEQTATWEITSDDLGNLEDITFAWAITYDEGDLGSLPTSSSYPPIGLVGKIGPISNETVPGPVSIGTEPVVRFADNSISGTVAITIDHCVTNLLFPYVTNVVGFETGIAISNTSLDTAWNLTNPQTPPAAPANGVAAAIANWGVVTNPQPFNTAPQAGTCNLYLFGSASAVRMGTTTASPVQAIASATTPNIAGGQTFADTLTTIFALDGGTSPNTLSGYVIARCEFQFGHGYAYLVDPSGRPQGYLALIIPDRNILNADTVTGLLDRFPIRVAQPFSNAEFDEQGEMLVE
jgi:hypothetical protein